MKMKAMESFVYIFILLCISRIVTADLVEDYAKEGLVPDMLDKAPSKLLSVSYNGKNILFGKEIAPKEVKDIPSIKWNFDESKLYTLLMTDPDTPSRQDPKYGEFLHWLLVNVPGDDFTKGELLIEYVRAGPPKDTGYHRFTFLLYQQPGKLSFDEKPINSTTLIGRHGFSTRKFSQKYNLGDPFAGNMFAAQYDDSVPQLHARLGIKTMNI